MKQTLDFLKNNTTLVLAIVSGYLYLCTYFFESGYLQVFDIPSNYLSIDLNTILLDSSQILQLILITAFIYQFVKLPFRKWMAKSYVNDFFGSLICRFALLIFLARFASIIPNSWLKTAFYIWIALVVIVCLFILKTYFKKGKAAESNNIQEEESEKKLNNFLFYDQYFWLILLAFFPIFICSLLGQGIAAKVINLPMINDSTRFLVIRKYGDQLLCRDYDYVNKKLGKQIVFVKIPINKPIVLVDYEIGNFYDKRFSADSALLEKPILKVKPSKKIKLDTLNNKNLDR